MAVAAGVICAWSSSVATIPSGWTRQTALDGRFLRGTAAGVDPGATGGATSHTHAAAGHSHTLPSHSHSGGSLNTPTLTPVSNSSSSNISPVTGVIPNHSHSLSGTTAAASDTVGAASAAWVSASNIPSTVTVLFIQSSGTPTGIPALALMYWATATVPTGWSQHPSSRGGYLSGAATGANGGTISSVSSSHAHTASGTHAHAAGGHTHVDSGVASSTGTPTVFYGTASGGSGFPGSIMSGTHTHTAPGTWSADVNATGGTSGGDVTTTTADPPYAVLATIQNSSGGSLLPAGSICIWTGTLGTIPAGWYLCDGTNGTPDLRTRFIRGAVVGLSDVGLTGGSTTHTHTAVGTHTHTDGHVHSGISSTSSATMTIYLGALANNDTPHYHAASANSVSLTTAAAADSASTPTETRPPFYDVAFIQYNVSNTVSITAPTASQVYALPSFTATWALGAGTQVTKRVVIYDATETTLIYDSGTITSATLSHAVPSGYLVNSTSYNIRVFITDTDGAFAQSAFVAFSTSWTNPAGVSGLSIAPVGGT